MWVVNRVEIPPRLQKSQTQQIRAETAYIIIVKSWLICHRPLIFYWQKAQLALNCQGFHKLLLMCKTLVAKMEVSGSKGLLSIKKWERAFIYGLYIINVDPHGFDAKNIAIWGPAENNSFPSSSEALLFLSCETEVAGSSSRCWFFQCTQCFAELGETISLMRDLSLNENFNFKYSLWSELDGTSASLCGQGKHQGF